MVISCCVENKTPYKNHVIALIDHEAISLPFDSGGLIRSQLSIID